MSSSLTEGDKEQGEEMSLSWGGTPQVFLLNTGHSDWMQCSHGAHLTWKGWYFPETSTYICKSRTQRKSVRSEVRADWGWHGARHPCHIFSGHLPARPSFWACAWVNLALLSTSLGTKPALSSIGCGVLSPSHAPGHARTPCNFNILKAISRSFTVTICTFLIIGEFSFSEHF